MKDEVIADQGAVATSDPLASEVGIEILRKGGNAVDAAVAIGFCLAVVEPMGSSIAGHGQMLIHLSERIQKTVALDYSHRAPKAASADMYKPIKQAEVGNAVYEVEGQANLLGYQSVGVPGVTAGLCKAHELFGSLPLEELMEPSIHYAEQGFVVNWLISLRIAEAMADFSSHRETAKVFLANGYPPRSGIDKVVQQDLGQTLRQIARNGAIALYQGEIPHAVEEDMKANGGLLRVEDFAHYSVQVLEPARTTYRGHEILGAPVPCGSTTALQTFNILEHFALCSLEHNSAEYLHHFIEAARHAFADRYCYLGDPSFVPVPLRGLLSMAYATKIAGCIDPQRALLEFDRQVQPWVAFARKSLHDPWKFEGGHVSREPSVASFPHLGDCTTHFGVIDKDRNMVSSTQTLAGSFGAQVMAPGTGLLFSNGMAVFNPVPGTANSIAGYKLGISNMCPLLVLRDGQPFLTVGAPGGRKIANCVTQLLMNILDHQMSIQEAIAAPRVDAADRETHLDSRISEATIRALRGMGHNIKVVEETAAETSFARPLGLMVHPDTHQIHAGVDVFRICEARGF